jgi:hypothetical protein
MGAPQPGAGQFYLAYDDPSPAADRDARPTREWGSAPDAPERRQLRGRKFYWHADPDRQAKPRYEARNHQLMTKSAVKCWIGPAPTTVPPTMLTQKVSFDNLTPEDLGGLLAAFEPQRVLPDSGKGPPRLHLGGGKPLGLGSCYATISALRVWDAESRYGGAPATGPAPDDYAARFAAKCPAEVTATWPALAAALAETAVDPALVWYPPGSFWSDRAANEKTFDDPFTFFSSTSGMYLKDKPPRSLIALPPPDAADQLLPIKPKATKRKADVE